MHMVEYQLCHDQSAKHRDISNSMTCICQSERSAGKHAWKAILSKQGAIKAYLRMRCPLQMPGNRTGLWRRPSRAAAAAARSLHTCANKAPVPVRKCSTFLLAFSTISRHRVLLYSNPIYKCIRKPEHALSFLLHRTFHPFTCHNLFATTVLLLTVEFCTRATNYGSNQLPWHCKMVPASLRNSSENAGNKWTKVAIPTSVNGTPHLCEAGNTTANYG